MSVPGTSRHFAATQQFGRFRSEADIERFSVCTEPVAFGPMLSKKSPKEICRIRIRNNRIVGANFLNRSCAFDARLESMLLGSSVKTLFRQHRRCADIHRDTVVRAFGRIADTPQMCDFIMARIPLRTLATVEDIMAAAVYLASPAAAMITGTHLIVDGGWTAQ
jgi:enoyl-ACP reductase-like protein